MSRNNFSDNFLNLCLALYVEDKSCKPLLLYADYIGAGQQTVSYFSVSDVLHIHCIETVNETGLHRFVFGRPFTYEPILRRKSYENVCIIWHKPGNSTDFPILFHVASFRLWSL